MNRSHSANVISPSPLWASLSLGCFHLLTIRGDKWAPSEGLRNKRTKQTKYKTSLRLMRSEKKMLLDATYKENQLTIGVSHYGVSHYGEPINFKFK